MNRVLIILAYNNDKLDLVKSKLPQDSFVIHQYPEANEEEACEWISGISGKKFLIADNKDTIPGYEFDTDIIVVRETWKDKISSSEREI